MSAQVHRASRLGSLAAVVVALAIARAAFPAPPPAASLRATAQGAQPRATAAKHSVTAAGSAGPRLDSPARMHLQLARPAAVLSRAGAARIDGLASLRGPASRRGAASVGGPTSAPANQRLHGTVALDGSRFVRRVR